MEFLTDQHIETFAKEVKNGLSKPFKTLPTKYIYDDEGTRIFEEIMELPEYYLTEAETEALHLHSTAIVEKLGVGPFNVIELGAGNGDKLRPLLDNILRANEDSQFIPIDISELAIHKLVATITDYFPMNQIKPYVGDYLQNLDVIRNNEMGRNLVLFLGSNIGNYSINDQLSFLKSVSANLNKGDYMLIGFDLIKPVHEILAAYDDSKGVTQRFHMNLLQRINNELGADFHLEGFEYYTTYNPFSGAIESFLISNRNQKVFINALEETFELGINEPIHTEYSYKFDIQQIEKLALNANFSVVSHYYDSERKFLDSLWRVL